MVSYAKWDNLDDSSDEEASIPWEANARTLRVLGNEAFEAGDLRLAVEKYQAALDLVRARTGPEARAIASPCRKNAAAVLLKLEEFELAARLCDEELEDGCSGRTDGGGGGGGSSKVLLFRGFARCRMGRFDEAVADLTAFLATHGSNSSSSDGAVDAYHGACAEEGQDDVGEARRLLADARQQIDARDCPTPLKTGLALLQSSQPEQSGGSKRSSAATAALYLAVAVRNHTGDAQQLPRAAAALAAAQRRAGDADAARETLAAALATAEAQCWPAEAHAFVLRALATHHERTGARNEAIAAYTRALAALDIILGSGGGDSNTSIAASLAFERTNDVVPSDEMVYELDAEGNMLPPNVFPMQGIPPPPPVASLEGCRILVALGRAQIRAGRAAEALAALELADATLRIAGNMLTGAMAAADTAATAAVAAALHLECLDSLTEASAREGRYAAALEWGKQTVERATGAERWGMVSDAHFTLAHLEMTQRQEQLQEQEREPPPPAATALTAALGRAMFHFEAAVAALEKGGLLSRAADMHLRVAGLYERNATELAAATTAAAVPPAPTPPAVGVRQAGVAAKPGAVAAGHYLGAAKLYRKMRTAGSSSGSDGASDGVNGSVGGGSAAAPATPAAVAALARKEEEAWTKYAAAVSGDDDERLRAFRAVRALHDNTPANGRGGDWLLRRVDTLHGLALAAARVEDFATAEQSLLDAVAAFEAATAAEAAEAPASPTLRELCKYLAVVRRRRGDLPGAQAALDRSVALINEENGKKPQLPPGAAAADGPAEAEALNNMLGVWRI